MTKHGVPSTITSTGRVVATWLPGEANTLTGPARYAVAYRRLRKHHGRRTSLRLLAAAWRHGFVLSGTRGDQ